MEDPELAFAAASAAIQGGLQCVEITMTTPQPDDVMRRLIDRHPEAHIGAGTVLSQSDADIAFRAGASFALSPVVDLEVIRYCNDLGMLAVPGAATPTEVHTAFAQGGAKLVKIFPTNAYGGAEYIKALSGPLGHIPLLPTSGIRLDSVEEYLGLRNVVAVGVSRQILTATALEARDWGAITANAAVWVAQCPRLTRGCGPLT